MRNIVRLTQKGDTIVEVLICLAIFGAMLASAFALTSRNQATSQSAQERSSAVRIAESQLEKLRTYTDQHKLPVTPEFNYFCMNTSGQPVKIDAPDAPAPDCREGVNGRYSYVIYSPDKAVEVGGSGSSYAVVAKWEGAITTDEEVKIFYALYDSASVAYTNPGSDIVGAPACSDGLDNDGDGRIDLADPGCGGIGSGADERDATTGSLSLSADCYASTDIAQGCPEVRLTFIWSDGSQDVTPAARIMSRGGVFENVPYSWVKDTGVTLKRVMVQPTSDKYDGSPSKDRNVYVKSLTNNGTTYDYTYSTLTICDNDAVIHGINYPLSNSTRFLCNVDPTVFFLDGATKNGLKLNGDQYSSCSANYVISSDDGFNGCFKLGNSMFMYRNSTATYNMSGITTGPNQLIIQYGHHTQADGPGLPSGYANFKTTIKVGTYSRAIDLPTNQSIGVIKLDIPAGTNTSKLQISWENNDGADPNLRIDRVMICGAVCGVSN